MILLTVYAKPVFILKKPDALFNTAAGKTLN
jgi:hypothetical protein